MAGIEDAAVPFARRCTLCGTPQRDGDPRTQEPGHCDRPQ